MKLESLLPLVGVIVGWGLKSLSDYLTQRKEDVRRCRTATFYILRAYKSLMDYERGTRYFRKERLTIDKFEPWRRILAARFLESVEANYESTARAVEILATLDPPLAVRVDNAIEKVLFTFEKDIGALANADPDSYAQLLYNQDKLVEFVLGDLNTVALELASRSGFRQKAHVARWFDERKEGTKDFMESLDEQKELLRKVVDP